MKYFTHKEYRHFQFNSNSIQFKNVYCPTNTMAQVKTHTYRHVHTHVYIQARVHIHTYTYINIHTCLYIRAYNNELDNAQTHRFNQHIRLQVSQVMLTSSCGSLMYHFVNGQLHKESMSISLFLVKHKVIQLYFYRLRPEEVGRHFGDNILLCKLSRKKYRIPISISSI